jgi:gliding motility-associated-like protein
MFGLLVLCTGSTVSAQTPTYIGTDIADGNYIHVAFPNVYNISSQYRVQATVSAVSGVRKLEFTEGGGGAGYSNVWRPYTIGQVLSGFNTMIDPLNDPASARYNSNFGGQTLKLPAITASNYYTVNIMTNRGHNNDTMAVLETTYNPVAISSVSQSPLAASVTSNCAVTVTATLAAAPDPNEYIYLRYSTVAFGNASTAVQMTVVGTTATATIPALAGGTNVQYYIFSSPISGLVANGQASGYYDCLSLNFNNNGGVNYSYSVTAAAAPSISAISTQTGVCPSAFIADTFIATPVNQGTLATYQWYKNGTAVPGATTDTLIDAGVSSGDTVWVTMSTGSDLVCPQPYTSNHLALTTLPITYDSVTITASSLTYCNAIGMDTFIAIPNSGGTNPNYQWIINEIPVGGATGDTFITNSFMPGDHIAVLMTPTSLACPSQVPAHSNSVNVSLFGTDSFIQNISLCQGGSYVINGNTYTTTNTYRDTFFAASVTGCDSVVVTNLTVNPMPTGTSSASPSSFCLGDSGIAIWAPVVSTDTVAWYDAASAGTLLGMGDSLTVMPVVSGSLTVYAQLISVAGCTAAARVPVTFTVTAPAIADVYDTICHGSSVTVGAHTYANIGTFTDTLFNASVTGCDSVVNTHLYVNYPQSTQNDTICQGGSVSINGHTYTLANTYIDTLIGASVSGCDSVVTTILTVNPQPTAGSLTPTPSLAAVCTGANVSAILTAGSGGAGVVTDSLLYSYDSGSWQPYTSGISLATVGHTSVDIQTYRTATGSGCATSGANFFSWIIAAQPAHGTLHASPAPGGICEGAAVSATLTPGTGGAGTTLDVTQYQFDGTGPWQTYTVGSTLATSGHTSLGMRTFRTATGSGCNQSGMQAISWTIHPRPANTIGTGPVTQCGGNVILDAGNAGSSYIWSDGSTNQVDTASTSGIYSVAVTTIFGCKDSFARRIYLKPIPIVNLGRDRSYCKRDSAVLNAGNLGSTYLWNDGSNGQYLTVYTTSTYTVTVTDTASQCTGTGSVNITFNTLPVVSIGTDTSFCSGSLMLDAGNTGATYLWSDSSIGQTLAVSSTGLYSVTVTNSNRCSASDTRLVTVFGKPSLGADVVDSICPFSKADLYSYFPGSGLSLSFNTATPGSVDTGTYTVIGTNSNGCMDTALITISYRSKPSAGADQTDSVCIGSTADLTTIIPNAGFTMYMWNTATPNNASPGVYQLVVGNASGCTDTAMATITNRMPQPIVSLGADTAQCGGTVTLIAGDNTNTYIWSNMATTDSIVVSTTGNYSVTVTNANGCSATASRLVTIYPVPSLGADVADSICPFSSADLYSYFTGSGLTLTFSTATPHSVDTGTYTVIGTNSNGCMDTALVTITYRMKPSAGFDQVDSVCIGNLADLTTVIPNTGFTTYTWNTPSPTTAVPGVYQLVVSNSQGCTDTAMAIVANRSPQPIINIGPDTAQCGGTVTLVGGDNRNTYVWSNGATSDTLVVSTTGIYSVTATNDNGCTATSSKLVTIFAQPYLGSDVTDSICPFSRGSLYNYFINSGLALNYSTATPASVDTGTYTIIGINSNGCMDTALVTIIYRQKPDAGADKTDSICLGYKYNLTTLYPNTGYTSYVWNTANPTAVDTGTYQLVVTNASGCTDTAIATIIYRIKPNLGGNKTDSVCVGYTYDLRTLYPMSAGYVSYVWNVANDSAVSAGVYQLIVTNASGCQDTAYATIRFKIQPVVTLPAYPNVCITNPAFQLTGGMPLGGTYHVDNALDSIFNPAGLGAGTHYVVYVYTNMQGCTDSAIRYITVYPRPVIYDTISLGLVCTSSPMVDLNSYFTPNGGVFSGAGVSGDFFYPGIAPIGTDSITYIYTDLHGCMDTAGRNIVVIPSVHVSLHTDQSNYTICKGQSITFTAHGAVHYQFFVDDTLAAGSISDTTSSYTTTMLNNHDQIKVVGSNACSTDTSEFIIIDVIPLPTVMAGPDTTIDLGQSVQLYAVATGSTALVYTWTPDSFLNFYNIQNPVYSGPDTMIYQVKVTDTHGCIDTASVTINVRIPDNVQLPNVITPNGDGKNDTWVLNPKINLAGSHIVIFNRWGEVVYETDNYANDWGGTYKGTTNKVPDGTYYYVLSVPAQNNHTYTGAINILNSDGN